MSSQQDPIVAEFLAESREHLAQIESQLLAIEAAGADADPELVNQVFREVHSIKGAAGFLGFGTLGQLAHDLENLLNLVRNRQFVPDRAATDVMLRAADALRVMLDDIDHSNEFDISSHVAALQGIIASVSMGSDPAMDAESSPPDAPAAHEGSDQALPEPTAPIGASDAASGPAVEGVSSFEPVPPTPPESAPAASEVADHGVRPPETSPSNRRPQEKTTAVAVPAETSIRVSVSVLDSLMNLAGELVLSRNQLLQAVGSTERSGLDSVAARVDQVTSELQEAIMQTRMQAVGTVFNKFPRTVRDLSNQLGKQCELTLEGEDVELDKSVIEAIGDPLTHLVRNAVDHGIESPQVRTAAGKPPVGRIVLRAFHQAGKVNISISDDGAGIDIARLKEKAIGRGLLTPERAAQISDREAVRLIFHPGFSLAKEVTGVSGRGVGMDVVKTNVERLGGTVGIDTRLGEGTTIEVHLPLTLAIIPSLIVRCGGERFAIPQASISELVRVKAQEAASRIERVKNAEVFRLRGSLLPLIRLNAALGLTPPAQASTTAASNIIVVEAGHLRYGLVVDGLHDSEEIVVKPLGRHMQSSRCLAGATILGDGKIALILDITGIASQVRLTLPEDDGLED